MSTRSWNGVQSLHRPVPVATTQGPWVDVFYRQRLDLWVVWSFIPPERDAFHRKIILLGAFRDRARARFAADTALAAMRRDYGVMPMMQDLMHEGDGDFMSILHGISHIADVAPWKCEERSTVKMLSRLCSSDIELLTRQIESHAQNIQDWRFMWLGQPGQQPSPTLIRVRGRKPAAAVVLEHDTFAGKEVKFWLDGKEYGLPCRPADVSENPLAQPVLDNLASIMQYCDKILHERYGSDTNAPEFLAILKEENIRESTRQMACAFGKGAFVGEA